ncbi:MAG: class I SAM-dependent methyltransferase [Bacillota bacterium]
MCSLSYDATKSIMMDTSPNAYLFCPVCGQAGGALVWQGEHYRILLCGRCRLQYAWPLRVPADFYEKAYAGECWEEKTEYQEKVTLLAKGVIPPVEHPFYRRALRLLKTLVPAGGYVFDIGCGAGGFLALLRDAGFRPLGCDVAPQPVELLRYLGFEVYRGTVEEYPSSWPAPAAITAFELLEHLPDPVGFLTRLRQRFPETVLIASVSSPLRPAARMGRYEPFDYPPHHLLRWSLPALRIACEKAGYTAVRFIHLPVQGNEIPGFGLARRLDRTLGSSAQRKLVSKSVGRFKKYCFAPLAWCLTLFGFRGGSVLVVASPTAEVWRCG